MGETPLPEPREVETRGVPRPEDGPAEEEPPLALLAPLAGPVLPAKLAPLARLAGPAELPPLEERLAPEGEPALREVRRRGSDPRVPLLRLFAMMRLYASRRASSSCGAKLVTSPAPIVMTRSPAPTFAWSLPTTSSGWATYSRGG